MSGSQRLDGRWPMNHLEGFSNIFLRAGGQSFHKEESITFLVNVNDAGGGSM